MNRLIFMNVYVVILNLIQDSFVSYEYSRYRIKSGMTTLYILKNSEIS